MGTYNLNGGLLNSGPASQTYPAGMEFVGGAGTGIFNQTAGTNNATLRTRCGRHAELRLRSPLSGTRLRNLQPQQGLLTCSGRNVESVGTAGTGIFTQTGGTNINSLLRLR